MASYRRFNEQYALISFLDSDSYTNAVYDLAAFVNCEEYAEIIVLLNVGDMVAGSTIDIDIEAGSDAVGTARANIKSMTQLTQAGGDSNVKVCIVTSAEEMEAALAGGGFFNVEVTVGTAASEFGIMVLGGKARYEPVDQTAWAEVLTP